MSAPSWFLIGLLAGAAAMLGAVVLWRAFREGNRRGRSILLAGGLAAGTAVAVIAAMSLASNSRQGTTIAPGEPAMADTMVDAMADSPPPSAPTSSAMPSASVMSRMLAAPGGARTRSARPMDEAAADLAARLERQGGTAADWNLLAQAYDFLGRPEDAQRARARAAQVGAIQRTR